MPLQFGDDEIPERSDSESPSNAGATIDNGRSVRTYLLQDFSLQNLQTLIPYCLGSVAYNPSPTGILNRIVPLNDPVYPFWYCTNIQSIRGVGLEDGDTFATADPQSYIPRFANYTNANITLEFTPRPFAVLPDTGVTLQSSQWFQPITGGGTSPASFEYAPEWLRYLDIEYIPQFDSVTNQQGQFTFQSVLNVKNTNNSPFTTPITQFLPNQIVKMWWFNVPLRLITSANSFFPRWLGRINQNAFPPVAATSNYQFPPGSLLLLSYTGHRFTPPYQLLPNDTSVKLCNIEIVFLYTTRKAPAGDLPAAPANGNYITAGHNLHPALATDRMFHYASTQDPPPRVPYWLSAPFEALFTDCDSPAVLLNGLAYVD
jgi:hypothetical protein